MANLENVIKVSQNQYDTLINGGTVGGYSYDANAIYLITPSALGSSNQLIYINNNGDFAAGNSLPDAVSASASEVSGATEAKSITIGSTSWNLPSGGGDTSNCLQYGSQTTDSKSNPVFNFTDGTVTRGKLTVGTSSNKPYFKSENYNSSGTLLLSSYLNSDYLRFYPSGSTALYTEYKENAITRKNWFGTYTFTLPSTTGTIALTSQLTSLYRHEITGFSVGSTAHSITLISTHSTSIFLRNPPTTEDFKKTIIIGYDATVSRPILWIDNKVLLTETVNNGFYITCLQNTAGSNTVSFSKMELTLTGTGSDTVTQL